MKLAVVQALALILLAGLGCAVHHPIAPDTQIDASDVQIVDNDAYVRYCASLGEVIALGTSAEQGAEGVKKTSYAWLLDQLRRAVAKRGGNTVLLGMPTIQIDDDDGELWYAEVRGIAYSCPNETRANSGLNPTAGGTAPAVSPRRALARRGLGER